MKLEFLFEGKELNHAHHLGGDFFIDIVALDQAS